MMANAPSGKTGHLFYLHFSVKVTNFRKEYH